MKCEEKLSVFFSPAQTAMEAMGLIAIIVNCYLIGQCGQLQRLFPWLSPEMAIISIVILEVPQLVPASQSEVLRAVLFQTFSLDASVFLMTQHKLYANQKICQVLWL